MEIKISLINIGVGFVKNGCGHSGLMTLGKGIKKYLKKELME